MVILVKGRWSARVEQSFEIEVETEAEIEAAIDEEMDPRNIVELFDFHREIESQETIVDDEVEA